MIEVRKRLAILVSGRGSNMEALFRATKDPEYPAEVAVVISDHADAPGLMFAKDNDIPIAAIERKGFPDKQSHEEAIASVIDASKVDLICLAGFMRILSNEFVARYEGKLINIHPSLLPKYKGLDTHSRALADNAEEHGCTIHFVNEEMDGGAIIAQASIPVMPDDTPDTLAKRVLMEEHRLYSEVVQKFCNGTIRFEGGKVMFGNKVD